MHAHAALRKRALERLGCRVTAFDLVGTGGLLNRLRRVGLHDRLRRALRQADPAVILVLEGSQLPPEMVAERPDLKLVGSPYSGAEYIAVPAMRPDVTILHAWKADAVGNAILPGELALSSGALIVIGALSIAAAVSTISASSPAASPSSGTRRCTSRANRTASRVRSGRCRSGPEVAT